MNKKLLYGIGLGAVAIYLYLNRNKFKTAPASVSKPASAPKPASAAAIAAQKPATPVSKPETPPIFIDDTNLPTWEDSLVTPSTAPTVPLNRELFEIPFSPDNILPKGLEYNYDY
jgi:hypothetical protein